MPCAKWFAGGISGASSFGPRSWGGPEMAKKVRFVYDDKAESRTITATSEASGFPATAAVDLDRSTIWKANAAGTQNLTVDLGSAQTISGLGIANHNVGALTGTQQLRASTDNFAASNDLIKTLVPGASGDYYANFTGVSYRYWRLVTAATGAERAQVGEFYLGTFIELAEWADTDFEHRRVWQNTESRALSGVRVVKQSGRAPRPFLGTPDHAFNTPHP